MRTTTNPELVQAIRELERGDTPMAQSSLDSALSASRLLVPVWNDTRGGTEPVRPVLVRVPDGAALPAFTDWDAVERWPDRATPRGFVILSGRDVCRLLLRLDASSVQLNPSSPIGVRIGKGRAGIVADGGTTAEIDGTLAAYTTLGSRLACLGRARVPLDSDAVLKLRELLAGYPLVKRAFLFEGSFGGPSRLVVGVDLQGRDGAAEPSETDYEEVMRAVGKSLLDHLGDQPGKIADGAWLKGELLRSVEREVAPFFEVGSPD